MSKIVTLITGNKNKLREFQEILGPILESQGVTFENHDLDLDEIQGSSDEVISRKARDGAKILNGNVIIEDTSLCFNALNGLPGPYIKWFLKGVGRDGLSKMLTGFEDKSAFAECRVAYCRPGEEPKIFLGQAPGSIVEPRGDSNFGWDPVFMPEGKTMTYAEMTAEEKNEGSHRAKAIAAFQDYITQNEWI